MGFARALCAAAVATALALAPATAHRVTTGASSTSAADRRGDWTVFVYLDGDNDLEGAAVAALQQMTRARGTQFVVLVDRSPGHSSGDAVGLGTFTDTALLRILDGRVELLGRPGELDMGDPATLRTFIATQLPAYRRAHNALVVWDHGGGRLGTAWDDTSGGDHLTVADLRRAIGGGLAAADAPAFDLLGFDSCLMATWDVAAALAPYASYLLASEDAEPITGWDWTSLGTRGGATTVGLAGRVISNYTAAAVAAGIDDTTLALVDLHRARRIDEAMRALAGTLTASGTTSAVGGFAAARASALAFGRSPQPALDYHLVDLGDLARRLQAVDALRGAASALAGAVASATVRNGTGRAAVGATGLSLYLPPPSGAAGAAGGGDGSRGSGADALRRAWAAAAARVPDTALPALHLAAAAMWSDRTLVRAALDRSGAAASVDLWWGRRDPHAPGSVVLGGRAPATLRDGVVDGVYDGRRLVLTDGSTSRAAFADLIVDATGAITRIVVPVRYVRASGPLDGTLDLAVRRGRVVSRVYWAHTERGVAEIAPVPGDGILPLVARLDVHTGRVGWRASAGPPLAADDTLRDRLARWATGTRVTVGLTVTDVRGGLQVAAVDTSAP